MNEKENIEDLRKFLKKLKPEFLETVFENERYISFKQKKIIDLLLNENIYNNYEELGRDVDFLSRRTIQSYLKRIHFNLEFLEREWIKKREDINE